ncbi:YbhB/YbcL family Raf kinase inhibitor-like protein [Auraticoccus sp. F435]|uniref:YbhB/YbcL family Raf kinase inhibitor-like protein n=1 Tax=Auraticoccus cholistanensis TaxID=2656650 RepID=A0A6A9V096_9ACTN|nr:YbhB/YbcL family Raf kinase inhibitor-like protein [Auraticoccus cholistanensis]MVA75209.1 YbhB/YbcL family Raf kinase inhibitor-like protein [Auraticoccus cholistanensis]
MNLERPIPPDPYTLLPAVPSFTLTSPELADGGSLGEKHAFEGGNTAPSLEWSGAPEGTRSFLVTCYDPDAPTPSGFWHWVAVGVPADVTSLRDGELPEGAFTVRNDYGQPGFCGAAPPPGDRPHRYIFAVTALDTDDTGLDESATPAVVHFMTLQHVLGRALLTGTFQIPA